MSKSIAQSWLALQCRMIPDVVEAMVAIAVSGDQPLQVNATWPEQHQAGDDLVTAAGLAASRRAPVISPKADSEAVAEQTLVVESGHPLGLFVSSPQAPRVIITNGLMVGCFDDPQNWNRAAALGVSNYGQMTAGGWMYIGPQGIVHGTYSTILNAGRAKLGIPADQDLTGRLFVTSGLGGMSGAQGKAIEIANGVGIIAEVDHSRSNQELPDT